MQFDHSPNEEVLEPFPVTPEVQEIEKGRWQFKSNANSWCKSEESQWEFYSLEDNYLIEKAYYDLQGEVALGDYIISLTHMIQKKKGAPFQQRPIRRVNLEGDVQEKERSSRYFETEMPKTMNKVFGSLRDFVRFFSRRSPEIMDFTREFEEIENSNDVNGLNNKIIPKLIFCLKEELMESMLKQLEDSSFVGIKRRILLNTKERHEELISLFDNEFSSFEEFYAKILKAYTMNTSLYPNLNKSLRNESWIEMDNLLPYAFCLCKAFFRLKLLDQGQEIIKIGNEPVQLFRGTAFDESSLSCYQNPRFFSWNSVTSTSTSRKVAEEFMYKSVDFQTKKDPVLFIIEVPVLKETKSEYSKWIDVHQFSAMPKEDEVILPPGSVFELMEASTDMEKKTIIKLKLITEVQSLAHKGLIMHGALQNVLLTEKEIRIICLEGDDICEALRCMNGNKLIERVEFCLCRFDVKVSKVMMGILESVENAKELKFISCIYEDRGEDWEEDDVKELNLKVEVSEMNDFYRIFGLQRNGKYLIPLKELDLVFRNVRKESGYFAGLANLSQLMILKVSFSYYRQITGAEVAALVTQGLRNLVGLRCLELDFEGCYRITDEVVGELFTEGLEKLTALEFLSLNFEGCYGISDKGVEILACKGVKSLCELRELKLEFVYCRGITDKGVESLVAGGLRNLKQLVSLTLNLRECHQITNEGVKILAAEGLKYLVELTCLSLNFEGCYQITEKGIKELASLGLQNMKLLASLNLAFWRCGSLTDKGMSSFGISNLKELTSLTLNFQGCYQLTDQGMRRLTCDGLKDLTNLTSLSLNFKGCYHITDKGIGLLALEGLKYLVKLTSLTLDISSENVMTDEGIVWLAYHGLRFLINLNSLSLFLPKNRFISDKGLKDLAVHGLKYLKQLNSLTLNLEFWGITELGMYYLAFDGLGNLIELTYLYVNFHECWGISDKGVGYFALHGLKKLRKLTSLLFDFRECFQITDKGIAYLADFGLQYLTKLSFLDLNLDRYMQNVGNMLDILDYETYVNKSLFIIVCLATNLYHLCSDPDRKGKELFSVFDYKLNLKFVRKGKTAAVKNQVPFLKKSDEAQIKKVIHRAIYQDISIANTKSVENLQVLTLEFGSKHKMTDEKIYRLVCKGLQYLVNLTSFNINFEECHQITDAALGILASRGLKNLSKLLSLSINFKDCQQITDEGLKKLAEEGLQYMSNLKYLALAFQKNSKITNQGVEYLAVQGLKQLTQLTSLKLDFSYCEEIADKGVSKLASGGLRYLVKLTELTLNFEGCLLITDEGVNSLASQFLKNMTDLVSLHLNFEKCHEITQFTTLNLVRVLRYFGFRALQNRALLLYLPLEKS